MKFSCFYRLPITAETLFPTGTFTDWLHFKQLKINLNPEIFGAFLTLKFPFIFNKVKDC